MSECLVDIGLAGQHHRSADIIELRQPAQRSGPMSHYLNTAAREASGRVSRYIPLIYQDNLEFALRSKLAGQSRGDKAGRAVDEG